MRDCSSEILPTRVSAPQTGVSVTNAERLKAALVSVEADERFTYAVMRLSDGGELHFCHRVDERWVRAVEPQAGGSDLVRTLLGGMTMFRLNAKHLDIQFGDGSRWDQPVRSAARIQPPLAGGERSCGEP
jgi:hypothetical protein